MNGYKTLLQEANDEYIVNKSRFIGSAAPVETPEQALAFLDKIRQQYKDATHNCYAYIIGKNAGIMRYSDDGEPSGTAGMPVLDMLKKEGLTNKIIISDKYISNPEILRNIDKLVDITKYNRILRVAKDFVARRWYMNAKKYNFPIEKCDFYGVVDNRNISKKDWYKSETGINQVMKEFINIGQLTIDKELDIN